MARNIPLHIPIYLPVVENMFLTPKVPFALRERYTKVHQEISWIDQFLLFETSVYSYI